MSWTASAVIKLPKKISKRAVITVSLLVFLAALINMIMFTYIEYVNMYKTADIFVEAQHRISQKELAAAVISDDIFTVFTIIEEQADALPYLDNIAVFDSENSYVADAKVLRENIVSDIRNIGIYKKLMLGKQPAGTVAYYISRMVILEQIVMNISGLLMLNIVMVLTGALLGGYLSFRITKPVIALSEHLQTINAPEHKTLEYIKKNKFRTGFRPKSENVEKPFKQSAAINFRSVKKRKG